MKVLFIGLGSIGVRHLKNLLQIGKEKGISFEIWAWRSHKRELPQEVKELIFGEIYIKEELGFYDIAFITNPTSCHYETLCAIKHCVKAVFIEKPIFSSTDMQIEQCMLPTQKAYVAAPMRFCKPMLVLKEYLSQYRPYCARLICSSYLPDWRPGVDYRQVYSARKELGGGVSIDLIHEWDYLVSLFGEPLCAHHFKGTYSDLEITSDDLAVSIVKYPDLLAEIHLDYFGRTYRRSIELFCQDGTLIADFGAGTVTLPNGQVIACDEQVNERYLREMRYFIEYVKTNQQESVNSPEMALRVLKLALGERNENA